MEQFVINASTRKETGKKWAARLRSSGKLPAVAYDEKGKSVPLVIDAGEFNKAWRSITRATLVNLKIDGEETRAFIKDTEYDIKIDQPLHADFHIVSGNKKVVYTYKIRYAGTPQGVLKGGYMVKHVPEVTLKALPQDLPESVSADVSKLDIGQKFLISDFAFGDKVEVLTDAQSVVVSISPPKGK